MQREWEYKQALALVNRCLRENPATQKPTLPEVQHVSNSRICGANTDYSIYLEIKPDQPEALYTRATIRYRLGLYEQAKKDL